MNRARKLLLILLAGSSITYGQAVLEGHAPQFANEILLVRQITNPITGHSEIIDSLLVLNDGEFTGTLPIHAPGWIFINSGIFRINMLLRPGFGYDITLPPKTKKSEADIRNPFFKPVIAHIQVNREYMLNDTALSRQGNDINSRIYRFDTLMYANNHDVMEARRLKINVNTDSLITEIEKKFTADSSSYFRNYRKYRYGIMKINSRDVGLLNIYNRFLDSGTPDPYNPAWFELFSEMYDEFLFYFSRTDEGRSINTIVNRTHNLEALKDTVLKHPAVPDRDLAELIILKEIFDIYHKDYFYKEALLMLLDSVMKAPESADHERWAREVRDYLIKLKPGQEPPGFKLTDTEGKLRTIEDFKGKYVYLNFCTPDNYSCLKEFPFLKAINQVHKDHLEIVTIMVTEKFETMKAFMDRNDYTWTALFYGNDDELLKDYNVRAYPTSYLIDPAGKLVQSPAALATEGLEEQLFRIMRSRGDL